MPAVSQNQQITAAIAKNDPGKLYKRNRGMLNMKPEDLDEFAGTKRTGLPKKAKKITVGDLMGGK